MDDLIERLRNFEGSDALGNGDFSLLHEAAAALEAARAEVERLNRILGRIVEGGGDSTVTIRAGTDAFAAAREYLSAPKPESADQVQELRDAPEELITWIPSADPYRRLGFLGFDPEAPMRALGAAQAALRDQGEG